MAGGHAGDFLLVRYTATGMLDPAFGGDGKVELDNAGRNDEARGVLGLDDGRLAVGGFSSGDFALVVLNGDGSVCPCHVQTAGGTATGAAWLLVDFGGDDVPYALIRQPDNRLIIGGGARGQDPAQSSFYLARLSPTASGG
ncbi:MAG TPA: hypothetical protein VNK95_10875, partial [Caldilineaceae bacterium]|nr:hypothetical protein [Caldilineaceae bacterium]